MGKSISISTTTPIILFVFVGFTRSVAVSVLFFLSSSTNEAPLFRSRIPATDRGGRLLLLL